jgi:hypothetical protein
LSKCPARQQGLETLKRGREWHPLPAPLSFREASADVSRFYLWGLTTATRSPAFARPSDHGRVRALATRLNAAIAAGFADPKMKARIAQLGGVALPGSPADFARLVADDTGKWSRVIKRARSKVE